MKTIITRLYLERIRRGLMLSEVSKQIGTSITTLSNIENGKSPTHQLRDRLVEIYNLPWETLTVNLAAPGTEIKVVKAKSTK